MNRRILAALLALCLMLAPGALATADRAAIPADPQRVVDLTGYSDVLYVMGLNVVGTANARANDTTRVPAYLETALAGAKVLGTSYQVYFDIEAIRALEPDLILIGPQHETIRPQLQEIATTVTVHLNQRSWKADMLSLGELFSRRTAVATWLDNYTTKCATLGEGIRKAQGDSFRCLALMISGGQLYAFVDAGLGGILYNDLGLGRPLGMSDRMGINMTNVSFGQLANLAMDYLFVVGSDAELKALRGMEGWLKLPVVRSKHVKELSTEPYLSMGYSCLGADALASEIATMLHAKSGD